MFLESQYALSGAYAIMLWWLTRLINRTLAPDPKVEVNGDILTILMEFNAAKVNSLYKENWEEEHAKIEKMEREFKKKIEIDPYDGRCLYRWKKNK